MLESFFRGDYMPHGHCYLWQPHILLTHVVSDALIALAYFSIPFGIMLFVRGRSDIKDNSVFVLFSLFIVFCGITHLFGIWTIWQGVYGIHGISKAATAVVSMLTAIYVFKNLPTALQIPSVTQFQGVVNKLNVQSNENQALLSQLETQRLARVMLDSLPVSALLLDDQGNIKLGNRNVEREFAIDTALLSKGKMTDFFVPQNDEFYQSLSVFGRSTDDTELSVSFVGGIKASNGNTIPAEISLTKIDYAESNLLVATIKNLSDLTEIKEALAESKLRLKRATSATEDGIFEFDFVNGTSSCSDTLRTLLGTAKGEKLGYQDLIEHIHPDFRHQVQSVIDNHWKNKVPFEQEYLGESASGEYAWFQIRGNSSFTVEGEPKILSGSVRYIQSQKETERSERQKSSFLTAIYESPTQAIWAAECLPDNEFKFVEYNTTALKRSGENITLDMILNKTLTELSGAVFPPNAIERIRTNYAKCASTKRPHKYTEQLEVNSEHWYQTSLYPVFDEQDRVTHVIGSAIDITEQKKNERALDEQNGLLASIINNSVCGLYVYDFEKEANIQINQRYVDILGYNLTELNTIEDFMALFHPDDRDHVIAHMEKVLTSSPEELIPLEYRFLHKKGYWVWCYSFDSVIKRGPDGKAVQMLGTFIDVTEKNKLLNQLSESNAYLERFAFVASHDLQEPLRKISSFSESLTDSLQNKFDSEDERYQLSRINDAALRMRQMIEGLLSLSRIKTTKLDVASHSLSALIQEAITDISMLLEDSQANIKLDVGDTYVDVDITLFKQVVQNLIQNAVKFVAKETKPVITISSRVTVGFIIVEFADNGIGIDPKNANAIFEPFRRLHRREEYSGSGIGLAIVKQIVLVHGGSIECFSNREQGATFVVAIPRRLHA
ncbi:PAS domain S-box protein [Alteromonas sediminis]|uniref:histidine kinase n=1 Tax=Alteromonas sediminis TaxID=2259342 RepID=A0A3N5ZC43_9ALTE|nr:PAS domain S-box protein [Alteromonas sediminis]RPJ67358.1 PAS domain S-box protein [Alteromonas sediminis]